MPDGKMKGFAIFFHQNQLLKIRKFQENFCNALIKKGILCVPCSPLMIQIENITEKSKISSIKILPFCTENFKKSYQKNEILSLKVQAAIDGTEKEGKIKIAKILQDSRTAANCAPCIFDAGEIPSCLEKINPFRICGIEIEETENSAVWKIFSEKWIKEK